MSVVLVIDAATGQNGLNQAKRFNDALSLDGLIVTKLDGTAKGELLGNFTTTCLLSYWCGASSQSMISRRLMLVHSEALVGEEFSNV